MTYSVSQSGDAGIRDEIELQQNLRLNDRARVVLGGSWRNDGMRSAWALPGQGTVNREISRLFGNLEWKPVAWFTGNAGLAGENDTMAGFNLMPRFGASFHVSPENTLRLGYSRAYRTAGTLAYRGKEEVLLPPPYTSLAYQYVYAGNPDLPAERLDTWEIGFLGDWRDWRSSLDVRAFNERIHNRLFVIDTGVNNNQLPDMTMPIQNVRIKGLEFQFKHQLFESTRLVLNQTFAKIDSDFLATALAMPGSSLSFSGKLQDIQEFAEYSMPRTSSSLLLMQKLPFGLDLSLAGYWQGRMKWTTNTWSPAYERYDVRLGYPFRYYGVGGEVALTVQSVNGAHREYKNSATNSLSDRIVDRRQWLSLRLDF